MADRIVITGYSIVSSIGLNAAEVLESLRSMKDGIGEITCFESIHQGKLPLAEVKLSNQELAEKCRIKNQEPLSRTAMLGIAAAIQLDELLPGRSEGRPGTALISATTVGGMDLTEDFYPAFLQDGSKGRLRGVINHDCGDSTERIASSLGISGFTSTVSTACSSSANSIMLGAEILKAGMADRVIAGGTDSVTRFTLNGFNTLMILDKGGCRPFDENRAGLTIGEGAAFLILEREKDALRENRKIFGLVSGYSNANDAYHQTASSPEGTGAFLAMSAALEMAGIAPGDIDYINVHGTGTQNNDLSEGIAMQKVFGEKMPPFSSTKSYTGHTLGAAGAIEAVISLLSINSGTIFPNLRWSTPMKELGIRPVTEVQSSAGINHVLSNSFGFGGNNSSLIISKYTGQQ
jgi:3-oxoacyl-[acyl-carrier-protein] synthase-1